MTSTISGAGDNTAALSELQRQQALAKLSSEAAALGLGKSSSSASTANGSLARLSALFGADGTNQSGNQLSSLANALGLNAATLASALQGGGTPSEVASLLSSSAVAAASGIDGTTGMFSALSIGADDADDDATSDDESSGLTALLGGASSSSSSTPNLSALLANLSRSGSQFDSKL